MKDSIPRSLALGMGSITALFLTSLASRVGTGSVSVFTLASNLEAVPLSLIGASYAVAAFPALSEASALKNKDEFTRVLSSSARHIILWSVVAVGLIAVLRAHIVRIILGSGAFDWNATRLTAALLIVLAVGLVAQGLVLLFSRALYAAKQSWRPFFYQLAGAVFTVTLAITFLSMENTAMHSSINSLLRVSDVSGTAIILIALAAALGHIFLVLLSLVALKNIAPGLSSGLVLPLRDGIISAVVGGIATYVTLSLLGGIAPLTTLASVLIQGVIAGAVGSAFVGLTLYLLKNQEFLVMAGALDRLLHLNSGRSAVLEPSAEEPKQP